MAGTTFSAANWDGYDEATVSNPSSALTDFSLMIDVSTLSATFKSTVQSDGGDIRLTKGDDTEIAFDLIDWAYNAGAPTGQIRCKWSSTLATSGTQKVRIWSGYSGTAVAYNATETYGSDNAYASHWISYWHDGGSTDRTSNGYDLTQNGSSSAGTIKGFPATDYPGGATNYAHSSSASMSGLANASMLGWVSPDVTVANMSAFGQWGNSSSDQLALVTIQSSNVVLCGIRTTLGAGFPTSTGTIADTAEAMIGITHESLSQKAYINGAVDGTSAKSGSLKTSTESITVAAEDHDTTSSGYFNGQIAMVQIHNVTLSTDWIAEEYDQTSDQATFWGTWSWTAAVEPAPVTQLAPNSLPGRRRNFVAKGGGVSVVPIIHQLLAC